MEFCPKCGSMMFMNHDNHLICSCGYVDTDNNKDISSYIVSSEVKHKDTIKMIGEDVDVSPRTEEVCPECGHNIATYKLLQTRSADEAPTRIFTCTKCKHTWRAYD